MDFSKLFKWRKHSEGYCQAIDGLIDLAEGDKELVLKVMEHITAHDPTLTPGSPSFFGHAAAMIRDIMVTKMFDSAPVPERKSAAEIDLNPHMGEALKEMIKNQQKLQELSYIYTEFQNKQAASDWWFQNKQAASDWWSGAKLPPNYMPCPSIETADIMSEDSIDLNDVEEML